MAKIDIDTLRRILQQNVTDIRKVNDIMHDIKMELEAEEEEKANRPPSLKKQFSIVLADDDGILDGKDLIAWVVQIPEGDSVTVAPERIIRAAYEYNTTPKGRRLPVKTIGDACETVSAKLFKEQNIWVKTKTPVFVLAVHNKIPTEKTV